VGISRDYLLKTRISKQPIEKIPGYNHLKYPRSKQDLSDGSAHQSSLILPSLLFIPSCRQFLPSFVYVHRNVLIIPREFISFFFFNFHVVVHRVCSEHSVCLKQDIRLVLFSCFFLLFMIYFHFCLVLYSFFPFFSFFHYLMISFLFLGLIC
jgi:hypothetical protein